MSQAELELTLRQQEAPAGQISGRVDLRLQDAAQGIDNRASAANPVCFEEAILRRHNLDAAAYGAYLTGQLFAQEDIRAFMQVALARAQAAPLSLRLAITPPGSRLHNLRWETLRRPEGDAPLLTGEHIRFSRYLSSQDWQPAATRPLGTLRALVAVAGPSNTGKWQLAEVDTAAEVEAARAGLAVIPVSTLAGSGQVTLNNLLAQLRDGYDILYLVAHGMLVDDEPYLLLEQEEGGGEGAWEPGEALVARIRELAARPRLAVLLSCQSGGSGGSGGEAAAQVALGPRLAAAGVPAVVAMQGNLTMATAGTFMPAFFGELQRDGLVDRAVAVARGSVRQRPDWWMPVLYSRLPDGRLWEAAAGDAALEIERDWFEPETVYIPAGPFCMGSAAAEGIPPEETPRHEVTLPAYRIGRRPVRNGEFAAFLAQRKRLAPLALGWEGQRPPAGREDDPVTGVTWDEALAYCLWLSEANGRKRAYTLPNEAEWEKAARGPGGRVYPWGDDPQAGDGDAPGYYGCLGMAGGVREWTCSLWGDSRRQIDPAFRYPWQDDGRHRLDALPVVRRIYRGSAADESAADMRCARRRNYAPEQRGDPGRRFGFRVLMRLEHEERAG